jgi:hypothetical protein
MRNEGERGSGERGGGGVGLSQTAEIRPAAASSQRWCACSHVFLGGAHCGWNACLSLLSVYQNAPTLIAARLLGFWF